VNSTVIEKEEQTKRNQRAVVLIISATVFSLMSGLLSSSTQIRLYQGVLLAGALIVAGLALIYAIKSLIRMGNERNYRYPAQNSEGKFRKLISKIIVVSHARKVLMIRNGYRVEDARDGKI
jgi:undecaprenyl pyrophosphate phosphatase UppP